MIAAGQATVDALAIENMKTLLAIDPGANGGAAVFQDTVKGIATFGFSTMTQMDIIDEFRNIKIASQPDRECVAVLEDIQRFSQQPAAMMSVYAESYGVIKGALMTLGFRIVIVRSQKWQKALALFPVKYPVIKDGKPVVGKNGKPKMAKKDAEWKRTLKARAQELYPGVVSTLQNADALLILEWARKQNL